MQNIAYRLALVAGVGGLVLLMIGGPDDIETPLGVAMLAVAVVLAGLGATIDLLGHVRDGATDSEEPL